MSAAPERGAPDAGPDLRERARLLLELGRFDQALAALSRHLATAPDDPMALHLVTLAHLGAGHDDDAATAARRAVAAAPDSAVTHWAVAVVAWRQGDLETALREAEESVRLDPEDADSHVLLGQLHLVRGESAAALASARTAVRLAPADPDAHALLGLVRTSRGDVRGGRAAYAEALRLDPQHARAATYAGLSDLDSSRLGRAARWLSSALRADPQDRLAREQLDAVLRRVFHLAVAGVGLAAIAPVLLLGAQFDGVSLAALWRALSGLAGLALVVTAMWRTLRHLPGAVRRDLRRLPPAGRLRWRWLSVVVLLACLALVAVGPPPVAAVALLPLTVAFVVSYAVVLHAGAGLPVRGVRWVAARVRTRRDHRAELEPGPPGA